MKTNPLNLSFQDPSLEHEFKFSYASETRVFNQIGISLSYFVWLALGIFSYVDFHPDFLHIAKSIAIYLYPIFTLNLLILSSQRYVKWFQPLTAVSNGLAGLAVIYVGEFILGNTTLTISGEITAILFAFFILRLRFTIALSVTLLYVVTYQITMLVLFPVSGEIALLSFLLWVVESTCIVGGNILERASRRMFYQNKMLKHLREVAEEENRAKSEFLDNMFNLVSVPIVVAQADLQILETNPSFKELFGIHPRYLTDVLAPSQLHRMSLSKLFLKRSPVHNLEVDLLKKDGNVIAGLVSVDFVDRDDQNLSISVIQDISDRKNAEQRFTYLAYHDMLTGLPNRFLLNEKLKLFVESQKPFAVLFIDLDQFKKINDTRGHSVGDQLLQKVAERLMDCVSEEDMVARLGGDEFTVILPVNNETEVAKVAQTIGSEIQKPFLIKKSEFYLRASIGISLYPRDGKDIETLLKNSDIAMYRSKELGGDKYGFFTSSMNRTLEEKVNLERLLHTALAHDEFVLHYQPQIDLHTGQIFGAEALIRWVHPQRGLISPEDFIPIAEETGMIIPIGNWVLKTACMQARKWNHGNAHPVHLSVNLSAKQFSANDMVENVDRIIRETGLNPNLLELELTETIILQSTDSMMDTMNQLKKLGVRISIDDFGTGYSSLGYLKDFPIDSLKIDRSFVHSLPTNEKNTAIVTAVITLARNLGLKSVAEGIETPEQLHFLQMEGCDLAQGYYYSPPLPQSQLNDLLSHCAWNTGFVDKNNSSMKTE